jgi:hypothetical protein
LLQTAASLRTFCLWVIFNQNRSSRFCQVPFTPVQMIFAGEKTFSPSRPKAASPSSFA